MFDELYLSHLIPWAIAGATAAGGLGFLSPSKLRTRLVWAWSLLPLMFVFVVFLYEPSPIGLPFLGLLLLTMLVPWATLTLLSYNLVRRFRDIQTGG